MLDEKGCEQCGTRYVPKRDDSRFCTDKCRGLWHREHDPAGSVRSVRRLTNGRVAITAHFADHEAERALHFAVGQTIVLGATTPEEPPQPQ